MTEAFLWANDGGAWSDPSLWRIVDVTGIDTAIPVINTSVAGRIPDHGPTAADTVLFANFEDILPPAAGPLTGGGSAAHVYTMPDFGPILLGDDPTDGSPDVYTFGDVHLNTRPLNLQGSILQADTMVIDGSSSFNLSDAGVSSDAVGRSFSADIHHLTVEASQRSADFNQIIFGTTSGHHIISGDFVNENGGTVGITGASTILAPATQPPPDVQTPTPTPGPSPAPVIEAPGLGDYSVQMQFWLDFGARAIAHYQETGDWFA